MPSSKGCLILLNEHSLPWYRGVFGFKGLGTADFKLEQRSRQTLSSNLNLEFSILHYLHSNLDPAATKLGWEVTLLLSYH